MFRARYINLCTKKVYWRTIWADSLNEADRLARRYCRKGFMLAFIEKEGYV
jgi:hypothetical protein